MADSLHLNTIVGVNAYGSDDASISRVGPAEWQIGGGTAGATGTLDVATIAATTIAAAGALTALSVGATTANGASASIKAVSEEITLSTIGATSDSVANLLPANSLILAVVARVTDTIVTATAWKLGDGTTAARFTAANNTIIAGTTDIGIVQWSGAITTLVAGPSQPAADKVRITTTGTASAGKVRVTVFYLELVAPTS